MSGSDAASRARLHRWISKISRDEKPRPVLRAIFETATAVEISALNLWACRRRVHPLDPGNVTLIIKTFQRPRVLARMLKSVRRVYSGPIVVADDSREPFSSTDPAIRVLRLPFNTGVSHGRNRAFELVDTPYVWLADDDMILLKDFDIARILAYLEEYGEVDLVGGRIIDLPHLQSASYLNTDLYAYGGSPVRPQGTTIGGLPVSYKTPNWYVARTEKVRELRYDEGLRMVDHTDFFTRAYGRLLCVLDRNMLGLHSHSYFDAGYQAFRTDTAADLTYLGRKWGTVVTGVTTQVRDILGEERSQFHLAALQVVADDIGVGVLVEQIGDGETAEVVVAAGDGSELLGALRPLGWTIAGDNATHPLWGAARVVEADDFEEHYAGAVPVTVANVAARARGSSARAATGGGAGPAVDAGRGELRWSPRAAWLTGETDVRVAALPIGPAYELTFPGDLIWLAIGSQGSNVDDVVASVLGMFDDAPAAAEQQIRDYIDTLISCALVEKGQ